MSKKELHFKEIKIHKTPGLGNGLEPYSNLSPHINIIGGPNASGKTTTAKTIQKLLNYHKINEIRAEASFDLDSKLWKSEIEMGYTKMLEEGQIATLEGLPALEEMSRYLLSDVKLAREKDEDLAENIIKEAIGGYDLEKAREQLKYSSDKITKGVSEYKELEKYSKAVEDEQKHQSKISTDEKRLSFLKTKAANQRKAFNYLTLYENLIKYKHNTQELGELKSKLGAFPNVIEKVREDDAVNLKSAWQKLTEIKTQQKVLDSNLNRLNDQIKELKLPANGVPKEEFSILRNEVQNVKELNNTIERLKAEKEELENQKNILAKNIGIKDADLTQFEGLNIAGIQKTDEFWQEGFTVYGEVSIIAKEIAHLKDELNELDNNNSGAQKLIKGIDALTNWLSEENESAGEPNVFMGAAIIAFIVISSVALGFTEYTYFGYGAGLLAVILVVILFISNKKTKPSVSKDYSKKAYKKTGLEAPKTWARNDIVEKLNELISDLEIAKQVQAIQQKLETKNEQYQSKNEQLDIFKTNVNQLSEDIKSTPFQNEINPANYQSIYWFTTNLIKWETAYIEFKNKLVQLESKSVQLANLLAVINRKLQTYANESAEDVETALYIFAQLEDRINKYDEFADQLNTIKNESGRLDIINNQQEDIIGQISNRLKIKPEDIAIAESYVNQTGEYQKLSSELNNNKEQISRIQQEIEQSSVYENQLATISRFTLDELDIQLNKYAIEAKNLEATLEEITGIRTKIELTKENHRLEKAEADKETAKQNLIKFYEDRLSSNIGDIIVDELKAQINTERMPKVFNRAKQLFSKFTQYRYELRIGERADNIRFTAFDSVDDTTRQLEELSTGTRVQLILAVRLAFIESTETTLKLPILADELLARSDTRRAEAIIEAMIEISREGRQVFYFTAQEDEMAKWKTVLAKPQNSDIESREYILGQFEGFKGDNKTELTPIRFDIDIPNPDGISYLEYGKVLNLPTITMDTANGANLHLWHFIDNTTLLHRLLEKGVKNYNSLQLYLNNGNQVEGLTDEIKSDLAKYVKLADAYFKLQRIGRSKPINRKILEESGAVSDTFIERVTEKMAENENDPERLLAALENGEVSRFTGGKITELREYLINNGYLSEEEPLTQEEFQQEIEKSIVRLDIHPPKAQLFLDRLWRE